MKFLNFIISSSSHCGVSLCFFRIHSSLFDFFLNKHMYLLCLMYVFLSLHFTLLTYSIPIFAKAGIVGSIGICDVFNHRNASWHWVSISIFTKTIFHYITTAAEQTGRVWCWKVTSSSIMWIILHQIAVFDSLQCFSE